MLTPWVTAFNWKMSAQIAWQEAIEVRVALTARTLGQISEGLQITVL